MVGKDLQPIGNQWATFEESTGWTEEKDLHISGTARTVRGTEFWLSRPRPKGISVDEWERLEQEKWDRIFEKGGK